MIGSAPTLVPEQAVRDSGDLVEEEPLAGVSDVATQETRLVGNRRCSGHPGFAAAEHMSEIHDSMTQATRSKG